MMTKYKCNTSRSKDTVRTHSCCNANLYVALLTILRNVILIWFQTDHNTVPTETKTTKHFNKTSPILSIYKLYFIQKLMYTPDGDPQKRVKTHRRSRVLIVKTLYCTAVHLLVQSWFWTNSARMWIPYKTTVTHSDRTRPGTLWPYYRLRTIIHTVNIKQDRQCKYNVTFRWVCATFVEVEKQ